MCYSKVAISALYNQVLECRQRKRHGERMATKYAKLWKHRVDLEYTARCVVKQTIFKIYFKLYSLINGSEM